MFVLYEIECNVLNCYYVGISKKWEKRIKRHRIGKGAEFTKLCGVRGVKILAEYKTESEAKLAEKEHVLSLRAEGKVVCGAGWTHAKAILAKAGIELESSHCVEERRKLNKRLCS